MEKDNDCLYKAAEGQSPWGGSDEQQFLRRFILYYSDFGENIGLTQSLSAWVYIAKLIIFLHNFLYSLLLFSDCAVIELVAAVSNSCHRECL